VPNVVPLSFVWINGRFYLCTREANRTVHNLRANPRVRLVFGPTRDVVLVDGRAKLRAMESCPGRVRRAFTTRVDWEIAEQSGEFILVVVEPRRVQAWRTEREMTIMIGGVWLDAVRRRRQRKVYPFPAGAAR
jgi:general stress protein 26